MPSLHALLSSTHDWPIRFGHKELHRDVACRFGGTRSPHNPTTGMVERQGRPRRAATEASRIRDIEGSTERLEDEWVSQSSFSGIMFLIAYASDVAISEGTVSVLCADNLKIWYEINFPKMISAQLLTYPL